MKKLLQITLAIFALATMANSAFAVATDIYISGSTAFRASAVKAIYDVFKQPSNSLVDYVYDNGSSANPYKASFMGWHGFVNGGTNEVYVHYTATGSAAGVIDLVNCPTCGTGTTNQVKFIADSAITGQGLGPAEPFGGVGTAGYNNGVNINGTGYATVIGVANTAAFTDASFTADANALASAPGNGPSTKAHILAAGLIDAGATAGPKHTVGVVDFEFTAGVQHDASSGSPTVPPFTNVTQQVGRALTQVGWVPLTGLTGGTSGNNDFYSYAILVGRNEDSGTRISYQAEVQNGFGQGTNQYACTFVGSPGPVTTQSDGRATGGSASTLTGFDLWPSNAPVFTEPTINWNTEGHSGYIGGGDVTNVLKANNPVSTFTDASWGSGDGEPGDFSCPTCGNTGNGQSKVYVIGEIGPADFGGGETALTYNGVPFTPANIINGSYSLWNFEHLYYTSSSAPSGSVGRSFADALADQIYSTDAPTNGNGVTDAGSPPTDNTIAGLKATQLHFTRPQEGAPPVPNY